MKRGFKGVQSHSRLLPRSACYPARSEVCLEIPLYLGQPIIFSQCQHNVSGSTCNAWITGNYSFCYDCPSNPNRYGNPDCIWPDVTILDSKHRPVYTFEVIGSSPIKPKTEELYHKIKSLKARFRFDADKVIRWSTATDVITAQYVDTFNGHQWCELAKYDSLF